MVAREIIRTFVRKITESYMKKSSNDIVRSLFLMAAMIIIGAGSAFAQSENDYFSLTKNAGTESESIAYYTTLGDAVNAAADGDKITLLKDYTITVSRDNVTTDTRGVSINKSITLDLNDHKITRKNPNEIDDYGGALISIYSRIDARTTLTLVDNGADKGTMGSIENNDDYGGYAIVVGNGSTLIAKGVEILTPDRDTVDIDDDGEAVIDDCVIHGKVGINLLGTATITNSDISGGNSSAIQVGEYDRSDDVIREGCLTIGYGVYISGFTSPGIDYQFGTVILKALPTFGQNRPTTSSTTRAKARATTREGEIPYDIGMRPGLSLTFEEGTFETPGQPMRIYIRDNVGPVDPATYTNPITTNYSKYVKGNDDKVINPNDVFKWKENDFTRGFRQNTDEVIFDHAAATVTSYSGTTTPTTKPYYAYYDFSEAIAAANSGYKTASDAGGTEFIPTLKMLEDVSYDTGIEIGDGNAVTKVTLDLNDHELKSNCDAGTIIVKNQATLSLVDTGTDPNKKGTIVCSNSNGYAIHNEGTADINGCDLSAKCGIYSNNTATIANCAINATTYGIYEDNGTTTVGEGVSFSGNREASIYKHPGTLTLTAWPTFGGSETEGYADIKLSSGRAVTFSGIGLGAQTQNATLRTVGSSGSETATLTFTPNTGYVLNTVDYNNTVITPENGAYTFTMPDADVTITATWKIQTKISLNEPPSGYNFYVLDEVGTGATLTDVVSSTAVTDENVTLTYTSSNEDVAKVVNGKIQALAEGTATITVSFAGDDKYVAAESKTIAVTVTLNESSFSVNNTEKDLLVEDVFTIVTTTTPAGLAVAYIPDDSGVVSVDDNGVVTALKEGTASVTVKVGGDGVYALSSSTVTFTVSKVPTVITVEKATLELKVNDEVPTGASLTPAKAGSLTYTSSNEKVAKVVNGKIQALAEGTATITVSFAGDDKYAAAESKTIDLTIVYPTMTVTLPAGLSTYYDNVGARVSDSQADGVKMYAVTDVSEGQVTLRQLPSKTVPANTPVIISNTGTEALDCQFDYTTDDAGKVLFASTLASDLGVANAEAISSALSSSFVGTAENIDAYEPANGATLYGLNGEAFVKLDAKPNIPANRCWLEIPGIAPAGTRTLTIVFGDGDTTSLDAAKRQTEEGTANWYSLDGRKLDGAPKAKGLYIMNGKKVIIKK